MNKKVLSFIALGIGCACGLAALFNLINGIVELTYINVNADALYNVRVVFYSTIGLVAAAGFALLCLSNVLAFVKKTDPKFHKHPVPLYAIICALAQLVVLTLVQGGYQYANCWVVLVLSLSVIVLFVITSLQEDKMTKTVFNFVTAGLAFVLVVVVMSGNGGLSFAYDLFSMFAIMGVIGYLVCELILDNQNNNNKKVEEKSEEKVEAKEETKEEE